MKNKAYIILSMIFPAIMGSCTQELEDKGRPVIPDGTPVQFSAAQGNTPDTRTEVSAGDDGLLDIVWSADDAIGIYGMVDGRSSGSNVEYAVTPSDNGSDATLSAVDPSEMFTWQSGVDQGYYAYYPYDDDETVDWQVQAHPFSLPSVQVQQAGNSPAHLSDYLLMTAKQEFSADDNAGGNVRYVFRNIFSVVEFRLKMDAQLSIDAVPVKNAVLSSASTDLAWPEATIDLTAEVADEASLPVTVTASGKEISLDITENADLVKDGYTSLWFVAAPGVHGAGDLTLRLTAIDNSVYTLTIPEGVTFLPNRHYVREYELSLDGFIPEQDFDVEIPELTVNAGEPLAILTEGTAETIEIWTGEEGHDFEYSDKDRMQEPVMTVNFKMALQSGTQRHPAAIKYSHDFSGEMTEEAILAATWTDVSDEFDFTTFIYNVDNDEDAQDNEPHDAGIVDCTDWFSEDTRTCRIAFFYHIDAYDADYVDEQTGTAGNGRTFFYLWDMWVRSQYPSEETFEEVYRQIYAADDSGRDETWPTFVEGEGFVASDANDYNNRIRVYSYLNGKYPYVVRLGSTFRPTTDRNSWFVLPELTRPEAKNVGRDTPVLLKDTDEQMQQQYTWTFDTPGTYNVVVVGTIMTLAGETYVTREFEVTVNE